MSPADASPLEPIGRAGGLPGGIAGPEATACLLALGSLPDIGPATLTACLDAPGPESIWAQVRSGRAARVAALGPALRRLGAGAQDRLAEAAGAIEPHDVVERHRALGCEIVPYGSARFPAALLEDPAPPAVLLVRGSLDVLDQPTVAIVGTRNATRAGLDLARELGAGLAERGVGVVSGLALGIDGAAHRGTIEVIDRIGDRDTQPGVGRPVGVVAAGPDRCYPRRHARLHREVAEHGVLLTETPIGGLPLPWRFPARNRLIAALAQAVVVVESRATGGSMSTAAEALVRGRDVLAVPGHPTAASSAGGNDLIADGATIVRDLDDVLVAIGRGGALPLGGETAEAAEQGRAGPLPAPARAILALLEPAPLTLELLVEASGMRLDQVSVALDDLTRAGAVERSGGWFERARPTSRRPSDGARR